jgi:hypothetical protein
MRLLPLTLLVLLSGCAGHVADFVGPRAGIVGEQLSRYGLNDRQTACVGERLGGTLTPRQLRLLERSASSVRQGYYEPERLTIRDFMHVASSMSDSAIGLAVVRAAASCDATPELIARRDAPAPDAPAAAPAAPAPRATAWLNLGAAATGQRIAVDASSLQQDATLRRAWFRLTDPGAAAPSGISYLLSIDCAARTIAATARRVQDAAGNVTEQRDFSADDARPNPIEGGTVMEIAYLSVCS